MGLDAIQVGFPPIQPERPMQGQEQALAMGMSVLQRPEIQGTPLLIAFQAILSQKPVRRAKDKGKAESMFQS